MDEIKEVTEDSEEVTALVKHLSSQLKKAVNLGKPVDFLVFMRLMSGVPPAELADQVASVLNVKPSEKQRLLEIVEVKKRLNEVQDSDYFKQQNDSQTNHERFDFDEEESKGLICFACGYDKNQKNAKVCKSCGTELN